jgi:hypothetical protein
VLEEARSVGPLVVAVSAVVGCLVAPAAGVMYGVELVTNGSFESITGPERPVAWVMTGDAASWLYNDVDYQIPEPTGDPNNLRCVDGGVEDVRRSGCSKKGTDSVAAGAGVCPLSCGTSRRLTGGRKRCLVGTRTSWTGPRTPDPRWMCFHF